MVPPFLPQTAGLAGPAGSGVAAALEGEQQASSVEGSSCKTTPLRRSRRATTSTYGSARRSRSSAPNNNSAGASAESENINAAANPARVELPIAGRDFGSVSERQEEQQQVVRGGMGADNKVAVVLAVSGLAVCAACLGCGDGLTGGNLAALHVRFLGMNVLWVFPMVKHKYFRNWWSRNDNVCAVRNLILPTQRFAVLVEGSSRNLANSTTRTARSQGRLCIATGLVRTTVRGYRTGVPRSKAGYNYTQL